MGHPGVVPVVSHDHPGTGTSLSPRPLPPHFKGQLRMHTDVAAVLIDIEAELRSLRLWDEVPPDPRALASVQPFAIDTLTLPQWLQFVFLPTMYRLVDEAAPLPTQCGIAPMADEYFRGRGVAIAGLLDALERIDDLLSAGEPDYAPGGLRGRQSPRR